jgi:hypothetical protein
MRLSPELLRKLQEAGRHEQFGRFDRAERCYLDVLREIDLTDRLSVGTIFNNLGVNSTNALDADKGIEYFTKAIEQLDGLQGEAIMQNAHAHWNIARLHILRDDPAAAEFSEKALGLYQLWPFTSQVDMADAQLCRVLGLAVAKKPLNASILQEAWELAQVVPFKSLNARLAAMFVSLMLSFAAGLGGAVGADIRRQAEEWVDPTVFGAVAAAIDEEMRRR